MNSPKDRQARPQAIALKYNRDEAAPRVVAKGYGAVAEHIIARAREHDLPVHPSPELVGLLMQVDLDAHIPPELYQVVAELLAWIYRLEHPDEDQAHATHIF